MSPPVRRIPEGVSGLPPEHRTSPAEDLRYDPRRVGLPSLHGGGYQILPVRDDE